MVKYSVYQIVLIQYNLICHFISRSQQLFRRIATECAFSIKIFSNVRCCPDLLIDNLLLLLGPSLEDLNSENRASPVNRTNGV